MLNVEFKEGGFSPKRKSAFVIAKDLEKILKEQPNALWFHTLEAVNNSTLTTLWTVFCQELSRIARKYQASVVAEGTLVSCLCAAAEVFRSTPNRNRPQVHRRQMVVDCSMLRIQGVPVRGTESFSKQPLACNAIDVLHVHRTSPR